MSKPNTLKNVTRAIKAQAHIHHAFLLGLQLMVSTRKGPDVVEDWMFKLFRRQHLEKFLSSFEKLGLQGMSDAVACAQYHTLSNGIGGVPVEYMYESDQKAWVRFRYPRWMYHGATICGVPIGVSRGFLKGWYAYNGVSLQNPRLGFVCVSEDMTGEFGLCGYFKEYDHDLSDNERLQFAKGELPPVFIDNEQPAPPEDDWNDVRLEKASRNYAMGYIRNGLSALAVVIGESETIELAGTAARLIGLQYYSETRKIIGGVDGDISTAANYLHTMMSGMGDELTEINLTEFSASFQQTGLRIVRGLEPAERRILLSCWRELWLGTIRSHRLMMTLDMERLSGDTLRWTISALK
jgi:hypothetical protein